MTDEPHFSIPELPQWGEEDEDDSFRFISPDSSRVACQDC